MKILDFVFAKIAQSYRGRRRAIAHASNFVSLLLLLTFGPPVGFILSLVPLTHIFPAMGSKTGFKFIVAIIVIPCFLFTYLRYDRAPDGYYDDTLNKYSFADKQIRPWVLYLLPVVLILFWVVVLKIFAR